MLEVLSRFYEVSYPARALVGLALLASVALWDLSTNGRSATRWREYVFWLACGAVGALFGMANDGITSRISKAYFVVGKGVTDDPGHFPVAVAALAAEAGSFAGIVVGSVFLLANNPQRELPQLPYGALAKLLALPIVGAIAVGAALGAFSGWDVQGLAPTLRQILSEHDVQRFLVVHRIHVGLYLGGLVATGASAVCIRRRRVPRE
jgi:hypothetical protein